LIEVMEDDIRLPGSPPRPHPEIPVAVRSITLSVMNLERASRFWADTLGLTKVQEVRLHREDHEALWELKGAERKSLLLWAGDFLVELVQYTDPAGKSRPAGHMICDQGLSHIALMTAGKPALETLYDRLIQAGYRANCDLWTVENSATVTYMNDDQGFTVELLNIEPGAEGALGFHPVEQSDAK
jgi:catechol 2,3-dioxygenase-like lactoylglutathione lyase family enzyme